MAAKIDTLIRLRYCTGAMDMLELWFVVDAQLTG